LLKRNSTRGIAQTPPQTAESAQRDFFRPPIPGLTNHDAIFTELLEAVLNRSDPENTIFKSRNSVLHGSDVGFATRQRSTQMVLWTFAVLGAARRTFGKDLDRFIRDLNGAVAV